MQQNIFEMLDYEQFFEYQRLEQTYGIWAAFNYARVVTSQKYINRAPRTSPRVGKRTKRC
jgi:hypothetical protein